MPAAIPERAAPPAIPTSTRQHEQALAERVAYHREREHVERSRQLRGLLILAFIVIVFSIVRAGFDRVFPPSWWHLW